MLTKRLQQPMKGYLAFPPTSFSAASPIQPSETESFSACTTWNSQSSSGQPGHDDGNGNAEQALLEGERRKRREQERALGESSEIEWVRAGGVLRDTFGRRDRARTEQIRLELHLQDVERQKMLRWEAYETRWRTMQSSSTAATASIAFVDFPWPLGVTLSSRDLGPLTRTAVSEFLFESLSVRTNTSTKREKIRSSLLRWHPDKISPVLSRVLSDDLELVREGIHVVFGILKALQDAERTRVL